MICPNCNTYNGDDARFCVRCGSSLCADAGTQKELNSFQKFNQKHINSGSNKNANGIQPPINRSLDYGSTYGYDYAGWGAVQKPKPSGGLGIFVGIMCLALIGTWWLDFCSIEVWGSHSVTMDYIVKENEIEWATALFCFVGATAGCVAMACAFSRETKGVYVLPIMYAAAVGIWYIYAFTRMLEEKMDYIQIILGIGFISALIGCMVIIVCSAMAMSSN